MASIEFRGVTKRYPDGTEAVKAIDLEIADGEFVILVGPSGCGKSTALRMIAGLEEITEGELLVGGEVVNDQAPKDRDIAMVFQNYALYPHMTVRGNMGFALKLAGVPKAEIRTKVERAAQALGIAQYLDRKPATLSGGQRQRVAMGRALVRDPKAFLMDEPLSNLDAKLRVQMRTEIARLQTSLGATTVYVTHDQVEAMTLGDRVVVMRLGVIQQVGAPRELYARPANVFVAGFMGSPAMNLVAATVSGDVLRSPLGDIPLTPSQVTAIRQDAGGREVIVGIRPEHFEDGALVGEEARVVRFRAPLEVIEELGSETFAHFPLDTGLSRSVLDALTPAEEEHDAPRAERSLLTARLDAASRARVGEASELCFDPERMHLFDRATGSSLVAEPALVV